MIRLSSSWVNFEFLLFWREIIVYLRFRSTTISLLVFQEAHTSYCSIWLSQTILTAALVLSKRRCKILLAKCRWRSLQTWARRKCHFKWLSCNCIKALEIIEQMLLRLLGQLTICFHKPAWRIILQLQNIDSFVIYSLSVAWLRSINLWIQSVDRGWNIGVIQCLTQTAM